jgi:hypothetical protein
MGTTARDAERGFRTVAQIMENSDMAQTVSASAGSRAFDAIMGKDAVGVKKVHRDRDHRTQSELVSIQGFISSDNLHEESSADINSPVMSYSIPISGVNFKQSVFLHLERNNDGYTVQVVTTVPDHMIIKGSNQSNDAVAQVYLERLQEVESELAEAKQKLAVYERHSPKRRLQHRRRKKS